MTPRNAQGSECTDRMLGRALFVMLAIILLFSLAIGLLDLTAIVPS